jgi:hypothetical protein
MATQRYCGASRTWHIDPSSTGKSVHTSLAVSAYLRDPWSTKLEVTWSISRPSAYSTVACRHRYAMIIAVTCNCNRLYDIRRAQLSTSRVGVLDTDIQGCQLASHTKFYLEGRVEGTGLSARQPSPVPWVWTRHDVCSTS